MASNASGSSSKNMANQNETTAIVANFPEDIIETIISFLPIKKAVSSGLISRRFKNSWKFSRDLSFDIDFRRLANRTDVFNIIQRVMDEHSGPVIERLRINFDPTQKENPVLEWIRKAITKGAEEIDLDFSAGANEFVLPSDILDGARLQVLKVSFCDLRFLEQFHGLRYLKTIGFENVRLPRAFSEAIFTNCLLLENFEIIRCSSEYHLIIHGGQLKNFKSLKVIHFGNLLHMHVDAPSLQVFHYIGDFCLINFKDEMPHTVEAVLHFDVSTSIDIFFGVEHIMVALRSTKLLSISSSILERLCAKFADCEYKEFQFCLWNVREIILCLYGSTGPTYLNPYDIACVLKKSPKIEAIIVDFGVFPLEAGPDWEFQAKYKFAVCTANFKFLKSVQLMNFKFLDLEMKVAEFIIKSAKYMENCTIVKSRYFTGAEEDEANFLRWLATVKPRSTYIYEHEDYQRMRKTDLI